MRSRFRTTQIPVRLVIKVLRGILPLTVIFLSGAAITVGVAWYLAVNVDVTASPGRSVMFNSKSDGPLPFVTVWSRRGAQRLLSFWSIEVPGRDFAHNIRHPRGESTNPYPSWTRESRGGARFPMAAASLDTVVEDARGWPFLAMRCGYHVWNEPGGRSRLGASSSISGSEIVQVHHGEVGFSASILAGGIPLATSDGQPDKTGRTARALPLIPIWPGFLANTMIFSAPLLVPYGLWWAVHLIRRRNRRRRGCCLECGHQLIAGQFNCPECGVSTWQTTELRPFL